MWFLRLTLFSLLLGGTLRAEEVLPKVQRELRARQFYFGEIHGRATAETAAAIRRFQQARGIDQTGNLDDDTLRALGLPALDGQREARALGECCTLVRQYLQAWQSGDWELEAPFFADKVNYYYDQNVTRAFIRETRVKENGNWPQRQATLLQRIASLLPDRVDAAQVTACVRYELRGASGPARVHLEDLLFRLEKTEAGWRITALKLLE